MKKKTINLKSLKETLSAKELLNVMGRSGGGQSWCMCYWEDLSEEGWCASGNPTTCEQWASQKYPQTNEWFGEFSHCICATA